VNRTVLPVHPVRPTVAAVVPTGRGDGRRCGRERRLRAETEQLKLAFGGRGRLAAKYAADWPARRTPEQAAVDTGFLAHLAAALGTART
jgi:hypothetical protein